MRKYIVLIFALLLQFQIYCQLFCQSENWRVLTIARPLTSINFISPTKGWIFGGDFAYKTTDGGLTWSLPIQMNPSVGTVPYYGIRSPKWIFFIDSLRGWACQNSNILLKTTNGGNSWLSITAGSNSITLQTVFFVNSNTGWAGGWNGSYTSGIVIKTTNGGNNWYLWSSPFNHEVTSIWMFNDYNGYCCSNYTDTLAETVNGGGIWTYTKVGNDQPVKRIYFVDNNYGWSLGNYHYVSRTTNGGINWTFCSNSIGNTTNIYFLNRDTGWITDPAGRIWKSSDGGTNWSLQRAPQNGGTNYETYTLDCYFKNSNTGWVSCGNGSLLSSTNGGNNWSEAISPPLGDIGDLNFIDADTGWLLSNYSNGVNYSFVYKTTNRGYNWSKIYSTTQVTLRSLAFLNSATGYACGTSGTIMKSTDGGNNWTTFNVGNTDFKSLSFLNNTTGFICGTSGVIIKTTNGGTNWTSQQSNTTTELTHVYFVDEQNGYVSVDAANILKTTNGGDNWTSFQLNYGVCIRSIYFPNLNTGFAVGDKVFYGFPLPPQTRRMVFKTTDFGNSWVAQINEFSIGISGFSDVFFVNTLTGWITSNDDGKKGNIRMTTDGGLSWSNVLGPILGGPYSVSGNLNCIFSLGENNNWVGGDRGAVLSTNSPIGIKPSGSFVPEYFSLSQNYPNPFNPQTKIKFDVSKTALTKLIIYDILGREVTTLVNEELKPGTYSFDWDGSNYASGIYFYRLVAGDYSETKKMVLMK